MSQFITKRLLLTVPLLLVISVFSFMLMHLAPGDPTAFFMDPNKPSANAAELMEKLREEYGLNDPVHIQYFKWLKNIIKGNWGFSFVSKKSVLKEIGERLPNSLLLGSCALTLALLVSIPAGIISAIKKYTLVDYVVTAFAFIGVSTPSFWLALILMQVFANELKWLPAVGMHNVRANYVGFAMYKDVALHLIMPTIVLSMGSMAGWTRYQRSALLEVVGQDYIRTARAKGVTEKAIIIVHALKNSLIPMITLLGMSLPNLVGGSFITETIFGWPGMGRLGVGAILARDYPIVMGVTMVSALVVVMGNLIADVAIAWADPRIRFQ